MEIMNNLKTSLESASNIMELYDILSSKEFRHDILNIPIETAEPGDMDHAITEIERERYVINGAKFSGSEFRSTIKNVIKNESNQDNDNELYNRLIAAVSRNICSSETRFILRDLFDQLHANFTIRQTNVSRLPIHIISTESGIQISSASIFEIFTPESKDTVENSSEPTIRMEVELVEKVNLGSSTTDIHCIQLGGLSLLSQVNHVPLKSVDALEKKTVNVPLEGIRFSRSSGLVHVDWIEPFYKTPSTGLISDAESSREIFPGDILVGINSTSDSSTDASVLCQQLNAASTAPEGSVSLTFVPAFDAEDAESFEWSNKSQRRKKNGEDDLVFQCTIARGAKGRLGLNFIDRVDPSDNTTPQIVINPHSPFTRYTNEDGSTSTGPAAWVGQIAGGEIVESICGIQLKGKPCSALAEAFASLDKTESIVMGFRRLATPPSPVVRNRKTFNGAAKTVTSIMKLLTNNDENADENLPSKLSIKVGTVASEEEEDETKKSPLQNLLKNFSSKQLLERNSSSTSSLFSTGSGSSKSVFDFMKSGSRPTLSPSNSYTTDPDYVNDDDECENLDNDTMILKAQNSMDMALSQVSKVFERMKSSSDILNDNDTEASSLVDDNNAALSRPSLLSDTMNDAQATMEQAMENANSLFKKIKSSSDLLGKKAQGHKADLKAALLAKAESSRALSPSTKSPSLIMKKLRSSRTLRNNALPNTIEIGTQMEKRPMTLEDLLREIEALDGESMQIILSRCEERLALLGDMQATTPPPPTLLVKRPPPPPVFDTKDLPPLIATVSPALSERKMRLTELENEAMDTYSVESLEEVVERQNSLVDLDYFDNEPSVQQSTFPPLMNEDDDKEPELEVTKNLLDRMTRQVSGEFELSVDDFMKSEPVSEVAKKFEQLSGNGRDIPTAFVAA